MFVSFVTLDFPDSVDDLLRIEVGPSDARAQQSVGKGGRQGVRERESESGQIG